MANAYETMSSLSMLVVLNPEVGQANEKHRLNTKTCHNSEDVKFHDLGSRVKVLNSLNDLVIDSSLRKTTNMMSPSLGPNQVWNLTRNKKCSVVLINPARIYDSMNTWRVSWLVVAEVLLSAQRSARRRAKKHWSCWRFVRLRSLNNGFVSPL